MFMERFALAFCCNQIQLYNSYMAFANPGQDLLGLFTERPCFFFLLNAPLKMGALHKKINMGVVNPARNAAPLRS